MLFEHVLTTPQKNKQIVERFVDLINKQEFERLAEVVHPNFVRTSCAAGEPSVQSRADLIHFLEREFETFPDAEEALLDLVSEGEKVAARHRFRGTHLGPLGSHPPTERVMEAHYIAIYRVRGGQIVEAWAEWDNLFGLRQLGLA